MRRSILIGLVVVSFGASGCGTVMNVQQSEPKVFGGTRMGRSDFSGGHQFGGIVGGPVCIADKPFSIIGDVVTLPYVVWKRDREASRPQRGTEPLAIESNGPPGPPSSRLPPAQTVPVVPSIVGKPVPEARRAAEERGCLFVWRDGPDGFPMCAAQYRRVEVQVKDGVVTSARSFSGKPWP